MSAEHAQPSIAIKRVYDPPAATDGRRFLVERLWPRGVKKTALPLNGWLREAAPSTALRQWFGHDPARWEEFQRRYRVELESRPDAWQPILAAAEAGPVTLLYSSRDTEHNNAVALCAYAVTKHREKVQPTNPARTATHQLRGFASPPCYLAEFDEEAERGQSPDMRIDR